MSPNGRVAPLRRRRSAAAAPPQPKPGAFDMAAHRKWFGEVCGANGRKVRQLIEEGRV